MNIRELSISELELIGSIDRAEHITRQYTLQNDKLEIRIVDITVSGFDKNDLKKIIQNQREILDAGGIVIGAFEADELQGIASVDARLFGETSQFSKMDILYVSREVRGTGIGKMMVKKATARAREFGAKQLYISATPTKSTVDFYLNLGAKIIDNPDKKLLELEPEDIHLSLAVNA